MRLVLCTVRARNGEMVAKLVAAAPLASRHTVADDGVSVHTLLTLGSAALRAIGIEPPRRLTRRSRSQNSYWRGVVVPLFAERCQYLPTEHDAVHDALMRVLCGMRPNSHPLLPIRISSTTLTTAQFSDLIERAQIFGAEKFGLVVPSPDPEWAFRKPTAEESAVENERLSR